MDQKVFSIYIHGIYVTKRSAEIRSCEASVTRIGKLREYRVFILVNSRSNLFNKKRLHLPLDISRPLCTILRLHNSYFSSGVCKSLCQNSAIVLQTHRFKSKKRILLFVSELYALLDGIFALLFQVLSRIG